MSAPAADWRQPAACQYTDPEIFFPEIGEFSGAVDSRADQARSVCIGCPSRIPCFRYAMRAGEQGIWGGLDDRQRRRERQRVPRRPPAEVFAAADARYRLRRDRRLSAWDREAAIDAKRAETDRIEEQMGLAA